MLRTIVKEAGKVGTGASHLLIGKERSYRQKCKDSKKQKRREWRRCVVACAQEAETGRLWVRDCLSYIMSSRPAQAIW